MKTRPTDLTDGAALEAFVDEHEVALVMFYTAGCSKCAAMEPVLGNVARATGVPTGLVNPGDDLDLVERFTIRSVPTLVVFDDGEPVGTRADGFLGAEAVIAFLDEHVPEYVPEPADS